MYNSEYEDILNIGGTVGDSMKGIVTEDGEIISWKTNKNGVPHHDDIDEENSRMLALANYSSIMNSISIGGYRPPLEYASDIFGYFKDYNNETTIDVDIGSRYGDFRFSGPVFILKEFLKIHPPPIAEDYEDGIKDKDWQADYEEWTDLIHKKPSMTVQAMLGRGGRRDVWQEKDEDWSKGFSVYNNNPRRKKRKKK